MEKGLPRLSPLSVQQKAELERIQEIKQRYLKGRKVREINAITAKALITNEDEEADFLADVFEIEVDPVDVNYEVEIPDEIVRMAEEKLG